MAGFDEYIDDQGYTDFLQQLVDNECLEGKALGITKQVIDQGEDSLSDKQKYVFKKEVLARFTFKCVSCDRYIPWDEMYNAYWVGPKICGDCSRGFSRVMKE